MKTFSFLAICGLLLFVAASPVSAQGGVKQGPQQVVRDPDLEKDSLHNLDVARQYFKLKKAYVAALQRCEEVIAGYRDFTKIDEILYMAGESSLNLAENRGKQPRSLYVIHDGDKKRTLSAEEFRDLAREYLSQLVNDFPESKFRKEADETLKTLGGPKPKESSKQ